MTLQDNLNKGKNTYATTLHAQHHHQAFGMPYFAGIGLMFDRLAFQFTYHQERSFSYGSRYYDVLFCGVGDPLVPHNLGSEPYIYKRDWSRSLMAKISYRLF